MDIRSALMSFFLAYREDKPASVYDYFANSRGSVQLIPQIRNSILEAARQAGHTSALETDKEMYTFIWDMGSRGIGWGFLLEGSGQCCFWETNVPLTSEQSIHLVLEYPALFGNITSMQHLFTTSLRMNEMLSQNKKILFCDVFFVAELNKAKDQDFCATGIRFWFDEEREKWVPNTLVFVTPQIRQDIQIPF